MIFLIAGGFARGTPLSPLNTEIFDPATGQFSPGGDLAVARDSFSAIPLTDGRVLVVGGEDLTGAAVSQTEIFDPVANRWTAGPVLNGAALGATVTLLTNGKVLIFGGEAFFPPLSQVALFE